MTDRCRSSDLRCTLGPRVCGLAAGGDSRERTGLRMPQEVDPDSSHSEGILELKNAIPGRNLGQTDRVKAGISPGQACGIVPVCGRFGVWVQSNLPSIKKG